MQMAIFTFFGYCVIVFEKSKFMMSFICIYIKVLQLVDDQILRYKSEKKVFLGFRTLSSKILANK